MTQNYYKSCELLWKEPQINWDGMLLGCCCNCWKNYGVNVFEVGLEKALSVELFTDTKKMLMGQIPERKDSPCSSCWNYKRMLRKKDYIKKEDILD